MISVLQMEVAMRNEAAGPLKRNEAAGPLKRNGEMVDKGEYLGVRFPAHCAAASLALMGRKASPCRNGL